MMLLRALFSLAGSILLLGCADADDKIPDYRYRLTVEVETPEGLRTGSSVIEVRRSMGRTTADGYGPVLSLRVRGQAVAVDLPDGHTLYALLGNGSSGQWASMVMPQLAPRIEGESWDEEFDNVLSLEGKVELPRVWTEDGLMKGQSAYPMLVTFADDADPTSMMQVDPDDLAESFGEGVSLKRVTVEMTNDPVTTGIEERLVWLDNLAAYRTDPDNPFTNSLPREIGGLRSK